jgi:hypothetical protein
LGGDFNIDRIKTKGFRDVTDSQVVFNTEITRGPTVSDHSAVLVRMAGIKTRRVPMSGAYSFILQQLKENN